MKKRILLTGNKGFIGAHLEKKLKNLDYKVCGFDIENHLFEDIRLKEAVERVFNEFKPEIVIHLAAATGVRNSLLYPELYFETNITGTYNLLKAAEEHNVKNFLFASSSSVYGDIGDKGEPLREDMVCDKQLSPYGVSKKAAEQLCKMFENVPTIVFRPLAVYGENPRKDLVIYKLIKAGITGETFYKYGDGSSTRTYTNVHDLNEGIVELIDYEPESNFEIFGLGGKEKITLNYLIEIIMEEFPNLRVEQKERDPADVLHGITDISKAQDKIGYNPTRDFKTEIEKLCRHYKEKGI